ncbi:dihydropteroate synthase [Algoriphagus ratkowskyi]|uniref:dihydropteroate synthase n=1 Tax=Algoriphagus ratkowskyi TaxID=57028 RepID=A0A2W7RQ64_9BACT|nr:dihydropteroate synthase [Algoriphagus ratkowskyi]PZX61086.1 dihydropteroate synthase [Algoriphagus ratkowskyi]TXD79220.1 dihydropteroate synthase [Algoriphagus ratkowskyi]
MFPHPGNSSKIEDKSFPHKNTLQIDGRLISWNKPQLMGIVNLTPDSFFEGSRTEKSLEKVAALVKSHITNGASILDLGGYSSRPGASDVSLQEELDRVIPAVSWITATYPDILISIDTFRAKVAEEAIRSGAHIINDISAGDLDQDMISTVARLQVPYIAMHMKGNPQNMQKKSNYSDILIEILYYFAEKLEQFRKSGIKDVIIDPGFGFAKTLEQNYYLLRNLHQFQTLSLPILVGISRKSMISKALDVEAGRALNGTTALNMFALCHGANILRIHDVKEANETLKLFNTLYP